MTPSGHGRGRAALWTILVLPVALSVGWLLGRLPTPTVAPEAPPRLGAPVPAATQPSAPAAPEVASSASPATPAEEEISSWTSLEAAVAESRRNGKPILLDFSAEWCPPCRRMKSEVFDDGVHGREVQKAVIPVAIVDRVREDGRNSESVEALQRQYGVNAFPTLVVYSPGTGRTQSTRGYGGAQSTLRWITQAAQSVR